MFTKEDYKQYFQSILVKEREMIYANQSII